MLSVEPTSNQSFKSIYTVRVPQKVFKNPGNMQACVLQVDKALSGGGRLYAYIEAFRALFGKKPTGKIMTCKNGYLIDAKEKEGMHTFSVISGEERNICLKKLSLKNLIKQVQISIEAGKKAENNEIMDELVRQMKWELAQKPKQEIEVNSLADLKELAGKL